MATPGRCRLRHRYLEKAFGGFTRSYPDDGHDALAFSLTGFLWDNALAHRKTLRNYGELSARRTTHPGNHLDDLYREHKTGSRRIPLTPRPLSSLWSPTPTRPIPISL